MMTISILTPGGDTHTKLSVGRTTVRLWSVLASRHGRRLRVGSAMCAVLRTLPALQYTWEGKIIARDGSLSDGQREALIMVDV